MVSRGDWIICKTLSKPFITYGSKIWVKLNDVEEIGVNEPHLEVFLLQVRNMQVI